MCSAEQTLFAAELMTLDCFIVNGEKWTLLEGDFLTLQ